METMEGTAPAAEGMSVAILHTVARVGIASTATQKDIGGGRKQFEMLEI